MKTKLIKASLCFRKRRQITIHWLSSSVVNSCSASSAARVSISATDMGPSFPALPCP